MTKINEPIQKVVAWSREHPALAVGLVAGAATTAVQAGAMIAAPEAAPVVATVV